MEKHTKIRMLGRASCSGEPLTPYSAINSPFHFMVMMIQFEKFQNWKETKEITKAEFEKQLANEDLTNAYLDVYYKPARYYRSVIKYEKNVFEHFLMVVNKNIVLIFFRPSTKPSDYL